VDDEMVAPAEPADIKGPIVVLVMVLGWLEATRNLTPSTL
jgi:hypothetical protein